MSDLQLLFTTITVSIVVFTVMDLVRRSLARRRARRRRDEALAVADEFMADVFGIRRGEFVAPADIKTGDEICWTNEDGTGHEHYTAGFDGDPGSSTSGLHMRPATTGRNAK